MKPLASLSGSQQTRGALFGLLAAALFGLSAPVAKILLAGISPVLLAGLLYLGAALGLSVYVFARPGTNESRLVVHDLPRLAGVILSGGVLGPILMLFGLEWVSALTRP
jgi:drug/metabolite transporter (DMT)-like permease